MVGRGAGMPKLLPQVVVGRECQDPGGAAAGYAGEGRRDAKAAVAGRGGKRAPGSRRC